ncbi:MAG: hypothetical protein K0S74_1542 [Chlamydiales bacterium]|jgi:hypothetical protein|nr:hypothetical protein [Chlamydiales bacterium]
MKKVVSSFTPFRTNLMIAMIGVTFLCGCGGQQRREASRIQSLLDESDLLIEARDYNLAKEKGQKAIIDVSKLLEKHPDQIEYLLLRSRAAMVVFMAKNAIILQSAKPQPQSLVALPAKDAYIDYDKDVKMALNDVKVVLGKEDSLSLEQKAASYATLATIYRLDALTMQDAYDAYGKAVNTNLKWKEELRDKIAKGRNTNAPISMTTLDKEIKQLMLSRIEVTLALKNWQKALDLLESNMAKKDLKYFDAQMQILENNIADTQRKLESDFQKEASSKKDKISQQIEEMKKIQAQKDPSQLHAIGNYTNYEVALMDLELELTYIKNNLIYRMICYHNLNMQEEFTEASTILSKYSPVKAKEIVKALK